MKLKKEKSVSSKSLTNKTILTAILSLAPLGMSHAAVAITFDAPTSSTGTSASGTISTGGTAIATYTLTQTTQTSMSPTVFATSSAGIEAAMGPQNDVTDESIVDQASWTFTVTINSGLESMYSLDSLYLSQSIIENSSGNDDPSLWTVSGLNGAILDPDDQIQEDQQSGGSGTPDYGSGDPLADGGTFFLAATFNDKDTWGVQLASPTATASTLSFQVDYESLNNEHPQGADKQDNNFESHKEWMSFGATISEVPEPSSAALLGCGFMMLILRRRKA